MCSKTTQPKLINWLSKILTYDAEYVICGDTKKPSCLQVIYKCLQKRPIVYSFANMHCHQVVKEAVWYAQGI